MSSSTLSQASRFNPCADLWLVPPIEQSHHTLQIDWYLNFQISQAQHKTQMQPSEELKLILQQTELGLASQISFSPRTLMISAINCLPCRWVVVVDNSKDLKSWTKDLFSTWQKLGSPSLRIFLPPQASMNDLFSHWRDLSSFEDFTVVLDS